MNDGSGHLLHIYFIVAQHHTHDIERRLNIQCITFKNRKICIIKLLTLTKNMRVGMLHSCVKHLRNRIISIRQDA